MENSISVVEVDGVHYEIKATWPVTFTTARVVGTGKDSIFVGFLHPRHEGIQYLQFEKNGSDQLQKGIYHPFHFRLGIPHCRITPTDKDSGEMEILIEIPKPVKP